MERERRNGIYASRGDFFFSDNGNAVDRWTANEEDGGVPDCSYSNHGYGDSGSSLMKLLPVSSSSSSPSASASPTQQQTSPSRCGYIQHPVSKFDTLAGVAIRYGVEVADIKRLNGLVTDTQMFALKSLHIPLPGRHPPSTCLSNGSDASGASSSEQTPAHHDLFDSFQSLRLKSTQQKVSSAMNSLQGYYGIKSNGQGTKSEFLEMAVYGRGDSPYLDDIPFTKTSPSFNPPLSRHRKSKSLANGFFDGNVDVTEHVSITEIESDRWSDKLVRRRQKSEADFTSSVSSNPSTPEKVLKEENGVAGCGSGFSPIAGKGLAQRSSKSGGSGGLNQGGTIGLGDSLSSDGFGVRKSLSTPSLQDQETGTSLSSIWPASKWGLRPDLQALSTAAIARPIFDGLPKSMAGRRNKTALD